jgi:hypothetical protein
MPDGDIPARFNHIDNVMRSLAQCLFLVFHRNTPGVFDQRVATHGNDSDLFAHIFS